MRRKLVRFLVLFMTMSMFLVSCEKTDKGQTDEVNESEFVLADNVIILDESHADSMSLGTLRPEGYYFTLLDKVK